MTGVEELRVRRLSAGEGGIRTLGPGHRELRRVLAGKRTSERIVFLVVDNNGRRLERNRKFVDSPLEGGVSFELVSEVKFASRAPMGRFQGDWERFLVP